MFSLETGGCGEVQKDSEGLRDVQVWRHSAPRVRGLVINNIYIYNQPEKSSFELNVLSQDYSDSPSPIPTLNWDFSDLDWTGLDLGLGKWNWAC